MNPGIRTAWSLSNLTPQLLPDAHARVKFRLLQRKEVWRGDASTVKEPHPGPDGAQVSHRRALLKRHDESAGDANLAGKSEDPVPASHPHGMVIRLRENVKNNLIITVLLSSPPRSPLLLRLLANWDRMALVHEPCPCSDVLQGGLFVRGPHGSRSSPVVATRSTEPLKRLQHPV